LNSDDLKKSEYFRRSYEAIDGLWFMILEGEMDFERALEFDRRVWSIVPKIQCRKVKELECIEGAGLDVLAEALSAKFSFEGTGCEMHLGSGILELVLNGCPWHDLMKKSGREHLAGRVGEVICGTEYPVWAAECGCSAEVSMKSRICDGGKICLMEFKENA